MSIDRSSTHSRRPVPDISSFLKARRAALAPEAIGLPAGSGRRRVRGLRREEAALLAGISVDYYTRIEQGRSQNISDSVLDSISRALRLTDAERAYLRDILEPARRAPQAPPREQVRPQVRTLLDAMNDGGIPAYVCGPSLDVLAWNRLFGRLTFDFDARPEGGRNLGRLLFLEPGARRMYPRWEENATNLVALLRAVSGRHPDDGRITGLVAELHEHSADFRRIWARQDVREACMGPKLIDNPVVGELELHYESMVLPADPGHLLCTYTAEPGSPSAERLRLLADWTARDTGGSVTPGSSAVRASTG